MINFHINLRSGVPPYLQLVQQVKQALRMGMLHEGDRLPSLKEVVGMVAINPNTVAKAYRELEHEGLVEGRNGSGTYVRALPPGPPLDEQLRLAAKFSKWAEEAFAVGLDDTAIEELVRSTLREYAGKGKRETWTR